jgi:hypothetical protein
MTAVRVEIDDQGIHALLNDPDGPVGRDILRRTLKVEARAVELCPVDEGRLRASIDHEVGRDRDGLYGRVGTNVNYALEVERGTGLFETNVPGVAPSASKGRRITPVQAKALRFVVDGDVVFAKSIKGMRPQPFLRPALRAAED